MSWIQYRLLRDYWVKRQNRVRIHSFTTNSRDEIETFTFGKYFCITFVDANHAWHVETRCVNSKVVIRVQRSIVLDVKLGVLYCDGKELMQRSNWAAIPDRWTIWGYRITSPKTTYLFTCGDDGVWMAVTIATSHVGLKVINVPLYSHPGDYRIQQFWPVASI